MPSIRYTQIQIGQNKNYEIGEKKSHILYKRLTTPHRGNEPLLGVEITVHPDTASFNVCETSNPDVQCYTSNYTLQSLVRYSTHPTMTDTTSHTLSLKCRVLGREAACAIFNVLGRTCLLYTSPSPRDGLLSRMPSSA